MSTMVYRPVASTGLKVSVVGFGTVKLGRNEGVKYPAAFRIPDDREALSLIACARDLGINFIDTAPAYGSSEERLGKLLVGQRNQWIICSKTGEEFENGKSRYDFSREHTLFSIERSLKRLNTDYLDIVLVHSDGQDLDIIERSDVFATLLQLKQQGKIRAFGMSTKTVDGGIRAAQLSDAVMVTYNLKEHHEQPVLDYCLANNKAVFIKKALASGHLTTSTSGDPVQDSLSFVFAHRAVSSAILGTISEAHLRHNVVCTLRALGR